MQKSKWPTWSNWEPDSVERKIGEDIIPDVIVEYGNFKDALHDPKLDHPLWYALAYHNLSTFYHLAHTKKCLNNIEYFDKNLKTDSLNAFLNCDFFIYGFFLNLRSALDTLSAQIDLIFIKKIRRGINLKTISPPSKYQALINKAEGIWYDEFSLYRNHLDHDIFLIRFLDDNGFHLPDMSKLYQNKKLDDNKLLQIYKEQNIYGGKGNPSNFSTATAHEQCSNYFDESVALYNEIYKMLRDDYNTDLKPYIQSEISKSKSP